MVSQYYRAEAAATEPVKLGMSPRFTHKYLTSRSRATIYKPANLALRCAPLYTKLATLLIAPNRGVSRRLLSADRIWLKANRSEYKSKADTALVRIR